MNNKKPLGNCLFIAVTKGLFCRVVFLADCNISHRYIMDKPTTRNSDAVRDIRLISPNEEGIIISVCGIDTPFA